MQAASIFVITILHFLLDIPLSSNAEVYVLPLSLNPLIQRPIELTGLSKTLYTGAPEFYSKVTLTDVSDDTHQDIREIVQKKLSVVFITVASSYVAGTLKESDLKYLNGSKWSYDIPVEELLTASNGTITKLNQNMEIYKFQELGMKVLQKRYNFNMSNIQNQLGLSTMEFFGANEEQWINIVGIITGEIINKRSKKLNLRSCYLAELVNKTEKDIVGFTLNEVDQHIYNVSSLEKKLPEFKERVLATTFNVTLAHLVNLSGLDITTITSMGLRDQIQLLTESMLRRFYISIAEIASKYKRSSIDILTPCPDEWESFKTMIVQEAFENQATNMSLTNKTLADLLQLPYANISKLTLEQMEHLIKTGVNEVKEKKNTIEQKKLQILLNIGSHSDVINLEVNAFSIIEAVTNFSEIELSLIYGWQDSHYLFAEMFSVSDLHQSCSLNGYNYTLFELAKINAGEETGDFTCKTLSALRKIWEKATVNEIEKIFGNLSSNSSIEQMLYSLAGGNLTFINRVLNLSADAQALCGNVTLDHISIATSHPTMYLKQMSFQHIINLAVELKANGSLFQGMKMTNTISPVTSRIVSSMHNSIKTTINTMTPALMMTRSKTHSMIYQQSSMTDDNKATRIATFTIDGSVNQTISTVNRTISLNLTIQHNSTNVTMTKRIANSTTNPTKNSNNVGGSANSLLSKGSILMFILFSSMYLALV